jgi:uncharacterized repeat protein (TIGR02543 family)
MNKNLPVLSAASALLIAFCGFVPDSDLDETSPKFVPPTITIDAAASSITADDTIHFDSATLVLIGNKTQSRFQVKIDTLPWPASWAPAGAFPLASLSEGRHVAYIRTMYEGGIKTFDDSIVFFVRTTGFRPSFPQVADTAFYLDTGATISFSASASGPSPLSYQWCQGASVREGKTDTGFTLTALTLKDTGAFFCIAANKYGSDTSRSFIVKFRPIKGGIKGSLLSSKSVKVSGAVVTMTPGLVRDTSNAEGLFEFHRLASGTYSIVITLAGYDSVTRTSIAVNDSTVNDVGTIVLIVKDTAAKDTGKTNLKVVYNGNGNTGGSVPVDPNSYKSGGAVAVAGNTGSLVKTGSVFDGWNGKADGSGTAYAPGDMMKLDTSNVILYAKWKAAAALSLTYDGNGKTAGVVPVDSNKYAAADSITVLGNTGGLAKTGFTFAGWNTAADGSGTNYNAGSKFVISSTSAKLFAKWTNKPTSSVVYLNNGADGGTAPAEAVFEVGGTVTVSGNTGNLAKTGYAFNGWNTKANGAGTSYAVGATFVKGATNDTLFAKWSTYSYTITFDGQNATTPSSPTVITVTSPATTVAALPTPPVKTGFTFAGWYTAVNGGGTELTASTVVTASDTVYAKWAGVKCLVRFNTQGGSAVDSILVNYGDKITSPASPSRTGYTFGGWYKETACTNAWDFGTAPVTGDMTLFAKWTAGSFTIKFNSKGGSAVDSIKANFGDKISAPSAPTRAGFTFGGWYKEDACTNVWDFSTATVAGDMTLFAKWTARPEFTVTFNSLSGSSVASAKVFSGDKITQPTNPTRGGYDFGGWCKESACVTAWDFTNGTVVWDTTLYAKWIAKSYFISYNDQGTITHIDTVTSPATTVGTLPAAPTRTGYTFGGWFPQVNGGGTEFTATSAVSMTFTVYAKWNANSSIISYNDQGTVTHIDTVTSPATTVGTLPPAPNRNGYAFGGWFTAASGGTEFTATTTVSATITVYARWTANSNIISYNDQGTITHIDTVTFPATTVGTLPAAPVKTGCAFGGWFTQINGSGTQFTATAQVTASITVYAKWTELFTLTVSCLPTGSGTVSRSKDTTYYSPGTSVTLTANPTSTSSKLYKLDGWSGDASGSGNSVTIIMNKNMAVTANFFRQFRLTATASGPGLVAPATVTPVDSGKQFSITATPNTGIAFKGWSSSNNGITIATPASLTTNVSLSSEDATVQGSFGYVMFAKQVPLPYSDVSFSDVVQTDDGGYMITGSVNSNDGILIKLNSNGDTVRTVLLSSTPMNSIQKANTYVLLTGTYNTGSYSSISAQWYLQNGNYSDSYYFGNTSGQYFQGKIGKLTSDNGYIIGGGNYPALKFVKLNYNKAEEWAANDSDGDAYGLRDGIQTSDGYLWAGDVAQGFVACLTKTDAAGNRIWKAHFRSRFSDGISGSFSSITSTGDGDCIIGGSGSDNGQSVGYIFKMAQNDTTQIRFFKKYPGLSSLNSVKPVSGGYMFVGSTTNGSHGATDVIIAKTNVAGEIETQSTYGGSDDDWGSNLKLTSDGGCIAVSRTNWVIKTDNNGEVK